MRGEQNSGWTSWPIVGTLVLLSVLGVAPAPLMAASGDCQPPALCAAAPSDAPSPVLGGMWVQIDGQGRLGTMSNPAIPQAISRLISQNSRGLRVVERKSGRLSMALDGRFLRAMVAHVEDDGSVVTSCDSDLLLGAAVDEGKE
jgi:hypothetical protein